MSHPSKPSDHSQPWYRKGLRFECAGCGACCTGAPGYVWVNKAEIEALAAALGTSVDEFERRCVRLVGVRKSLVELPGGDCVFFDARQRRCTVYEFRPRQCRTWPFWESNLRTSECWAEMAQQCPGANCGCLVGLHAIRAQVVVMRV